MLPRRLQQIQSTGGVGIEVVEGDCRREIVRRLRCGVYDHVGLDLAKDTLYALAISNIYLVVPESPHSLL